MADSASETNIEAFLKGLPEKGQRLATANAKGLLARAPETIDALFHLPLLALAVMVIARHSAFRTGSLGRNVALLLVEQFSALRRSPDGLVTSLMLRRRCADALAFLESMKLVAVSPDSEREVTLTPEGKGYLDRAARKSNDLGLLVRELFRNHERAQARIGDEHST